MTYSVREATKDDLFELVFMKWFYFKESSYRDFTWQGSKAWEFFENALADPDVSVIIVHSGRFAAGYAVFNYDSPFMDEEIVVLSYVYVMPEYRQKECSQILMDFVLKLCEHRNVRAIYASNTAGFSDNGVNARAFGMLMSRHGFEHIGNVFRKGAPAT